MKKRILILTEVFGVAIIASCLNFSENRVSATVPGSNTLISSTYSSTTAVANNYSTGGTQMSGDGKYVLYDSQASDLVNSDTNNNTDVFVRNVSTSITERVSVSTTGTQADGASYAGKISDTGRYVVFISKATNLAIGTTLSGTYPQLFLRDTQLNTTTLLSKNSSGSEANNYTDARGVSSDGRFVLFLSSATNLGVTVTNSPRSNLYMLDRSDGSFTIVNRHVSGGLDAGYQDIGGEMSCDGSLVVFQSGDSLTDVTSYNTDIYLLDRRAGNKLTNLSISFNGASTNPTISCNGDYIGFATRANNFGADVTSTDTFYRRGYVYSRINGQYKMIDQATGGTQSDTGIIYSASNYSIGLSDNGNAVFASPSTNLVSGGTSGTQMFVHNFKTNTTELLSQNSSGTAGNLNSSNPDIDNGGKLASYLSDASNLVGGDTNGARDTILSATGY